MNNILNNKFYLLWEKAANFFLLNLLWVIACIPIVTIFPATAAMYGVIREWKMDGETSVLKPFWNNFKLHFKKSLLFEIIWVLIASLLFYDFQIVFQVTSTGFIPVKIILVLITATFLCMSTLIFPLIIQYDLKLKDAIKNMFIISFAYFPTTLLIVISGGMLFLVVYILPITLFILVSLYSYLHFHLSHQVFRKIEKYRLSVSNK